MHYLAHRIKETGEEQTLKVHLEETANLAAKFAKSFGYEEWGYCLGMLHDIGKYSAEFQSRIRYGTKKVDHSTAGAKVCHEKGGCYGFLKYCIAGHHAGLPDTGDAIDNKAKRTLAARLKRDVCDYSAFEQEIKIPELTKLPFEVRDKKTCSFVSSIFIRMLYSCLVDADYLDAERFMRHGQVARSSGDTMDSLNESFCKHISKWLNSPEKDNLDCRKTEILEYCRRRGKDDRGLFRLTVPTGGGKTTASLGFALEHAIEHKLDHIIYVIPYTSIIEQNAQVFRDILGNQNVLEDHCNVDYDEDEELKEMHLASENWDKPVIVTTSVQFFESFFSNKPSKCRKLHNIANSVIIFDEAQMLPNDYLKPCVLAMEELIRHYHSSIVLCTATQPALNGFFSKDITWTELCPNPEEQFVAFSRVSMKNAGLLSDAALINLLLEERQALCILNTREKTKEIYQAVQGEGVYHLSTLMYPSHRKRIVQEIKERLNGEERCIVIATSLVEAGVDLDFRNVYRQLAGLDSIIQAAGRCNRKGEHSAEESQVYIFQLEKENQVPNQKLPIAVSKAVMEKNEDYTSLEAVQEYFQMLYHCRGESLDKKNVIGQFCIGRFPFETVSRQFKLIEENTKTIFIAKEKCAVDLLQEIRDKGMIRMRMRKAAKYCVNVSEGCFKKMCAMGMLEPVKEEMQDDFFVLRDNKHYLESAGLSIAGEYGDNIWF